MKNFLRVLIKVIRAYSLEEKVLSLLFFIVLIFIGVKGVSTLFGGNILLADGGSYTEAKISIKPILINPLYVDFAQTNRDISSLVFSGLLKYEPKLKNFVDDLATLKISENKKEYLFVLKDIIKWHDGQNLTADDVMFTYSIIQNADFQNTLLKANFEGVEITKIDDKTVKFGLDRPNSFFITNFNVGILPKHLLDGVAVKDLLSNKFNVNPVGSGPYKMAQAIESSDDGKQKVVLENFAEYYGARPKIGQIKFNVYPDEESLIKEKTSINVVSRFNNSLLPLLADGRFQTISYSLPQYTAVFFNEESKLVKSLKLRIALVKSVDKDELLTKLENKVRVDTPLMDLNQKDWLFKPDQKEANGALFDAGYKFKKDDKGNTLPDQKYRLDKEGKVLELKMIARGYDDGSMQQKEVKDTVQYLLDSWEKVGVKVNIEYLNESDFMVSVQNREYDLILTGQSMGYNLDTFPFWHSSQVKQNGLNLSGFKSFGADAQIEKIRETFDLTEKANRQKQLAEIIAKDVPALFLYRPQYLLLTDNKIGNIYLNDLDFSNDRFVDIADWCLGKDCK